MKFGLMLRPQDPPHGESIGRRWQECLTAAEVADQAGFDGVFVPEHHMRPDGHSSASLVACAALAARTQRIDIGTACLLLPYYHPIQVAEQAALVDVISGGRLRMGCALGAVPDELDLFGLEQSTQVSRFEESIDLIQRAWAGEHIDHDGDNFRVRGHIAPLPPAAQIWLGATSAKGAKRPGRLGLPWLADSLHSMTVLENWAASYRESAEAHGNAEKTEIVLMRDGWVGDSLDEVEQLWWPTIGDWYWSYFSNAPQRVLDHEPSLEGVTEAREFTFDGHRADRLVVGDPEQCIETIRGFRERLDFDYLIMSLRMPAGPSHADELRCIRRFGADVISAFR